MTSRAYSAAALVMLLPAAKLPSQAAASGPLEFGSASAAPGEDAADANDDGKIDITDAILTLDYLFNGNVGLRAPGTRYPWFDPTADQLGCGS